MDWAVGMDPSEPPVADWVAFASAYPHPSDLADSHFVKLGSELGLGSLGVIWAFASLAVVATKKT